MNGERELSTLIAKYDSQLEKINANIQLENQVSGRELFRSMRRMTHRIGVAEVSAIDHTPTVWSRITGSYLKKQIELDAEIDWIKREFETAQKIKRELEVRLQRSIKTLAAQQTAQQQFSKLKHWFQSKLSSIPEDASKTDPWLLARAEKRLADLDSLMISNVMFIKHYSQNNRSIELQIDAFQALETKLYPIWLRYLQLLFDKNSAEIQSSIKIEDIKCTNAEFAKLIDRSEKRDEQNE